MSITIYPDLQSAQAAPEPKSILIDGDNIYVLTGEDIPVIPYQVLTASAVQIRLALNQLGLLTEINTYIANNAELNIYFEYSTVFYSDNPLIAKWADSIGKGQSDIDAIFNLANTF